MIKPAFFFTALLLLTTGALDLSRFGFRSAGPTAFNRVTNISPQGPLGTFSVILLELAIVEPYLTDYAVALTRQSALFPTEALTPGNSVATLTFSRDRDAGGPDPCTLRLSVRPNRAPRGEFVFEGLIDTRSCLTWLGGDGVLRPGLAFVDGVQFVRAEQSDFGGGSFPVRVARRRDGPLSSADLSA